MSIHTGLKEDLLKKRNSNFPNPKGRFAPSYEGPYVVERAFLGRAFTLTIMDRKQLISPVNSDSVVKYYV